MDVDDLNKRIGIPGQAEVGFGEGGLACVNVNTELSTGQIYLHGAHVTHFQPAGGEPVLFMSEKSWFQPGKPIRGGVPICWPWFGPNRDVPEMPHGFARLLPWQLSGIARRADGGVSVEMKLTDSDATRAVWPHAFALRYVVTFARRLTMSLSVCNTGDSPMVFEEALHTYLRVDDIREVGVVGLTGAEYIDKVAGGSRQRLARAITFTGETDQVYLNTTAMCRATGRTGHSVRIDKAGSRATVVWNPWIAKAKAMPDFGDDEWPGMLCIETANVAETAVELAPGESHEMTAVVAAE